MRLFAHEAPVPPAAPVGAALARRAPALALFLVLGCFGTPWPPGGPAYVSPAEDLGSSAGSILSAAIRLRTVNPPGNERPVARLLVRVLEREGVEAALISTPPGPGGEPRAAAWGIVRGSGRARPLVLLSHLDVVPAEEREWAVDPFAGVAGGGYVVGRGALDAKGVAVVHLLTLVELQRRARPLGRDVIFLATPDEESGGHAGAGFLLRQRRDLLRDAVYLITEGGGILVSEHGSKPVWGVAVTEKSPCWIGLETQGPPGHGAAAAAHGAVPRLVAALDRVRRLETDIRVVPEVSRMFAALAPLAPSEDRAGLADLARSLEEDAAFRERFLSEPGRNALVRNTVAITVLEGSSRTNVVPARARAELDARLLPGESCHAFMQQLREVIADPEVRLESLLEFSSRSSPVDTALFRAIEKVAAETDPGAPVVPRVIAGFTDAHWFRELGIDAYGFVPRWLPASETRGIHGPNERISIRNLERGVRTLVRILEVLDDER